MNDLATILLQRRRTLVLGVIGFALAGFAVLSTGSPRYLAYVVFVPHATEIGSSTGLRSLAGQLGLSMGGAEAGLVTDAYLDLLSSETIALRLLGLKVPNGSTSTGEVTLREVIGRQASGQMGDDTEAAREVSRRISLRSSRRTGTITATATLETPEAAVAVAAEMVAVTDSFNRANRKQQAYHERTFLERRLAELEVHRREAELRLTRFLTSNRSQTASPDLAVTRERLTLDVDQMRAMSATLRSAVQDASLREAREQPTVTVIESPRLPTRPLPRFTKKRILTIGIMAVACAAALAVLTAPVALRAGAA